VLSIVPAYAITATMLLGWRVRWRLVALYSAAAVVLLGVFAAFDASRPEDKQTHLGRLVHRTSNGGWGAFTTVVHRKIDANLAVLFRSQWTVMFPLVLACVLYLLIARAPGLRPVVARVSELRATLIGLAVLAVLGFALNDSGIAVPGLMLGVVAPVLIVIAVRGEDAFPVADETISVTDDPVPELVTT
jgi:hypothetical protein